VSSDFRADELERTCKKASLSKTAYHFFPSLKILSSPGGFEREGCKTGRLLEIESRPYTHGYILVALCKCLIFLNINIIIIGIIVWMVLLLVNMVMIVITPHSHSLLRIHRQADTHRQTYTDQIRESFSRYFIISLFHPFIPSPVTQLAN